MGLLKSRVDAKSGVFRAQLSKKNRRRQQRQLEVLDHIQGFYGGGILMRFFFSSIYT
jgi:hypothetical protein